MSVVWQRPPEALGRDVAGLTDKLLNIALIVARDIAGVMEAYAKSNAPWQDRTSNARQGLTCRADLVDTAVIITLYHIMDYGIWLEVANAGKYAIIMETIYAHFAQVIAEIEYAIR